MVTTASLVDLLRRFVLGPDESVEGAKEFPDGPGVFVQTSARSLLIRAVHNWLLVETSPGVAAVVVVSREDIGHTAPYERAFLLRVAGEPVDLLDPAQVALLGRELRGGSLEPAAYAEILVEFQWPLPGLRRLVADPALPPPGLPGGALALSAARPLKLWDDEQGNRWLVFYAVRHDPDTTGAGLEVTLWSVRVPAEGPARWVRRLS